MEMGDPRQPGKLRSIAVSSIGEGGPAEEVICILEEVSGECLVEQMRAVPEALGEDSPGELLELLGVWICPCEGRRS